MQKLPDAKAYELLKKAKIPIARFALARTAEQAAASAKKLKYPVVLKIDAEIIHKAQHGCVKVVKNEAELPAAFEEIMKNAHKATKKINGMIVQEFAKGTEFIVGGKRDAQFGPVVLVGSGGIMANLLKDVSFRLAPLSKADAAEAIAKCKAYETAKDSKKALDALADIASKAGTLLAKNEKILELDINPVMVSGNKAVAADVRIIV
jgi:acetyl-CoA synthetase (ADP-forming)